MKNRINSLRMALLFTDLTGTVSGFLVAMSSERKIYMLPGVVFGRGHTKSQLKGVPNTGRGKRGTLSGLALCYTHQLTWVAGMTVGCHIPFDSWPVEGSPDVLMSFRQSNIQQTESCGPRIGLLWDTVWEKSFV